MQQVYHRLSSFQEASTRLRQYIVVVWLERQPAFPRRADLLIAESCFIFRDERFLVPAALLCSIDEQLSVALCIVSMDNKVMAYGEKRITHKSYQAK